MAKETYAESIIKDIPELVSEVKSALATEGDEAFKTANERRAQINMGIIMSVFGAEIVELNDEYALKFNKKPASTEELAELCGYLKDLQEVEATVAPNEEDIPGATAAAVVQLQPSKINKKTLTEYLLNGPQAIGRLEIGPTEVMILASLSEKYRKHRRNKIILISVIAAAAIAAGITTTCLIVAANKKKDQTADDAEVDVDEEEVADVDDEAAIDVDEPAPHVDLDM